MILPGILSSQISGHLFTLTGSMDALATVTVPSGGASSITFSAIPQSGYSHLQIRFSANIAAVAGASFQFNGDTNANYVNHYLVGAGSTANAYSGTGSTVIYGSVYGQGYNGGSSTFTAGIVDILDYASVNKYKTTRSLIGVDRNGTGAIQLISGLWQNTSAINQITYIAEGANTLTQYTTATLYGVK